MNLPQVSEQRRPRSDPHGTIEHHLTDAFAAVVVGSRDSMADRSVAEYGDKAPGGNIIEPKFATPKRTKCFLSRRSIRPVGAECRDFGSTV